MSRHRRDLEEYIEDELYCRQMLGINNVKGRLARRLRELSPLLSDEELLSLPLDQGRFLVVDLETTGMAVEQSAIMEIGAVEINGFRIGRELASLVNPGSGVPRFISKLTGIRDSMLVDAPPLAEVLPTLDHLLRSRVLVCHNLRFDQSFLKAAYREVLAKSLSCPSMCTVKLSRRVYPELASHNLDSLASHLRVRPEANGARARHRALGDARVTARALIKIMRKLHDEGMATVGEMITLQSRKKPRPTRALLEIEPPDKSLTDEP